MSKVQPLQGSFIAGEITPRLHGNTTSPYYKSGLAHCENFEVTPQGSLEMRSGTQFIDVTGENDAVLHTFSRDIDDDVVVVIGDANVTLYNHSGRLDSVAAFNLINDPTFLSGFLFWESIVLFPASATAISGVGVSLTSSGTIINAALVYQSFPTPVGDNIQFKCKILMNIPIDLYPSGHINIYLRDAANEDVIAHELINYDQGNYPPDGTIIDVDISGAALSSRTTVTMTVGGAAFGEGIECTLHEISAINTDAGGIVTQWPTPAEWKDKLRVIHSDIDSSENRMFFTCFGAPMYELNYDKATNGWDFLQFTPAAPNSGDGGGIDWTNNWPSTVTFHQGRLWLAGSPNNRSAIWASETFNYDNFALIASPVGNSPLEFEIASSGAIQWIDGLKFLLVGTDLGETIGRSSGPVITSSDFDFPREQTWGSTRIQPAKVGSKLLFITSDASKVRSLFDGGDIMNGYNALEETFMAEHLTRKRIGDIVYAQNPKYQLSCLLTDGSLAQATIYDGAQVNAWYRLTMDDNIHAVTTSNDIVGTSMWVAVSRAKGDLSGDHELVLEVKSADSAAGYNLDSWVTGIIEDNQITGLGHLNGYECSVVINNQDTLTLHPPRTPVNGIITLESWAAGGAMVGLPYTATAKTLKLEGTSQVGTSQASKQRFNEIFARLITSAFPKLNGQRAAIRTPSTPMNLSQPLVSDDVSVHDVSWNGGVITIEQDLPLPTHITALFGKAKGNTI